VLNGVHDVLRSEPPIADLHLRIDRTKVARRTQADFVRAQRHERRRALGDVGDDEDQAGASRLHRSNGPDCLLTVSARRSKQDVKLAIVAVVKQVFLDIADEVVRDDVDDRQELRAGVFFVGLDQALPLIAVGVMCVVERALPWVG
jgi:hypothetical protein